MKIEKANKNDFGDILDIQKKAFISEAEFYHNFNIQPLTQTLNQMLDECCDKVVLKATIDAKIVGSIRANTIKESCWLNKLIVLPEYQRQGIGEKLLREIEIYFPDVERFVLETGAYSESNIRLYQKVGYKIIGKTTFDAGIEAVIMEKEKSSFQDISLDGVLYEINEHKKIEVAASKAAIPISEFMCFPAYRQPVPSFSSFLLSSEKSGIIAEHKRRSPSKGIINGNVNLRQVITGYEQAGVSAVSVLTDQRYFGGNLSDLKEATQILNIPVLRKDFIIDEYQIHEAKAFGAAVILLIAASLTTEEVDRFAKLAHQLGMEVLFEIHHEDELSKLSEHVDVVGVNNRDLKTFKVDIQQSVNLVHLIPDRFIKISESGISNPETVKMLKKIGYQGFLMGENFMKENDPGEACKTFINQLR